jgi:hypothetical protein
MTNTSAYSGYLTPTSAPIEMEGFEDTIQAMVTGVTGLDGTMVRPRYQAKPPSRPSKSENWCAIGVKTFLGTNSSAAHDSKGDGHDVVTTWTDLEVLATFHGPRALELATRLKDGLLLEQNRAVLRKAGIAVTDSGEPINAPEKVSGAWTPRIDLPLNMQWETRQTYGVLNLLDAPGSVVSDNGVSVKIVPQA